MSESHSFSQGNADLFQIFMQAPIPIAILIGEEFRCEFANAPYLRMVGRDVVGKAVADCFGPGEVDSFMPLLQSAMAKDRSCEGKALPLSLPEVTGSDEPIYLDVVYQPFKDSTGRTTGILALHYDVTDQVTARRIIENSRRAVENERENFYKLFRQTPEMVCVLRGPDHVFEFVNPAHITALGFDATGMAVRVAQPESVEVHGILDDVYRTGVTAELREIPVTVGTKLRYFNLTYAARRDDEGRVNGVMILGSEITDQVEAREAIIQAKEAADDANREKSNFIANMSHEIRTPIGVILGFCEQMSDPNMGPVERQDLLNRVVTNAKGLTRIIDDILDLAKVESGKLEVEEIEFSLKDLLTEVQEFFRDRARQKAIRLNLHGLGGIHRTSYSDPARLRQILINIVGNAIKFTTRGSVDITLSVAPVDDGRYAYEIAVKDSGIGMDVMQAQRIFEPFVQADASISRGYGGTGLGLSISKRLAKALGGNIFLRDYAPGDGCTFVLTFADGKRTIMNQGIYQAQSSQSWAESKKLEGLRVLLAEDTLDNQLLVSRILKRSGASVDIANNGEEAIAKALSKAVDVVLMDVQMPQVDGYEATRSLRYQGFRKPIIALTAHAMLEERKRSLDAGCDAHLTKPINPQDLVNTIEALVSTH